MTLCSKNSFGEKYSLRLGGTQKVDTVRSSKTLWEGRRYLVEIRRAILLLQTQNSPCHSCYIFHKSCRS